MRPKNRDMLIAGKSLKGSNVASEIERKRVQAGNRRPNQARFHRAVLGERPRCVTTNLTLREIRWWRRLKKGADDDR